MCRFIIAIVTGLATVGLVAVEAPAQRIDVKFGYHRGHPHRHHYRPHCGGAYRYPYPYGYPAYPYGYSSYRYWYAPIYIPAERLYGPGAVQRFMGVDQWGRGAAGGAGGQQQAPNIIIQQRDDAADEGNRDAPGPFRRDDADEDDDRPEGVSRQAANLAWRFIGFGDAQFATGDYFEANIRYRKAVAAAPRMGAPYFRQGYALMASGRWDLAAESIRRGLGHDPDWPSSGFSNAELYADRPDLKVKHIEQLARAAEEDENDADRLLLMGVLLHFDGKPDRARPFFERVEQLIPGGDQAAQAFLK
jgi:tetratricopeptide (TPR) repeat protein